MAPIHIPPEIQIRATIRPGSVYYFVEESFSSDEPHYFIVLNRPQKSGDRVFLLCASSRIETVLRRRRNLPRRTCVKIKPEQYSDFPKLSIINCNEIIEKPMTSLIRKLKQGDLKPKVEMKIEIVRKLAETVRKMKDPLILEKAERGLQEDSLVFFEHGEHC